MKPNIEITMDQTGSTADDVRHCLSVLYQTRTGTQALDRAFGLDWSFLDMPQEAAQAAFAAEIIAKSEIYEPRADIRRVTFTGDENGTLRPKVEVSIHE